MQFVVLTPIGCNKYAIVDDEDYELVSQYKWRYRKQGKLQYAEATRNPLPSMHRLIMKATKGTQIDHINRNGLDNRKLNLRFVNYSQNQQNGIGSPTASSRYKGVSYLPSHKSRRKIEQWQAYIKKNGKQFYLGDYYNETIAAWVYDQIAKQLFGEYARFNFPQIASL